MTHNAPSEILRRWPRPLIATLAAIAATGLGTAAPATATTTVPHTTASRASVTAAAAATQKHVYLRSALGNEPYVTTENGWSGSTGMHAKNVIRARAATPGPWEGYRIDYLGPSSGNAVHLWSDAAQAYVTASSPGAPPRPAWTSAAACTPAPGRPAPARGRPSTSTRPARTPSRCPYATRWQAVVRHRRAELPGR
ncbi:hypothetical protein ACFV2H_37320 [Streptomyces sp. NPDC059629]|uniref:hypothetical protein n=1 Tax=Streptomyces sp. NPDC059629 TaxID=3346889 RepID=UPI0036A51AE8